VARGPLTGEIGIVRERAARKKTANQYDYGHGHGYGHGNGIRHGSRHGSERVREHEYEYEQDYEYGETGRRLWRWARRLPVALIIAGLVLELSTPREVTVAPLFTAAPLAAAAFLSLPGTILTGAVSSTATILFSFLQDGGGSIEAEARSVTSVTVSILAVGARPSTCPRG